VFEQSVAQIQVLLHRKPFALETHPRGRAVVQALFPPPFPDFKSSEADPMTELECFFLTYVNLFMVLSIKLLGIERDVMRHPRPLTSKAPWDKQALRSRTSETEPSMEIDYPWPPSSRPDDQNSTRSSSLVNLRVPMTPYNRPQRHRRDTRDRNNKGKQNKFDWSSVIRLDFLEAFCVTGTRCAGTATALVI
jgi:hypothetical protein